MRTLWTYHQSRTRLPLISGAADSPAFFRYFFEYDLQSEHFSSRDYLNTSTPSIDIQSNFSLTGFRSKHKDTIYCTWFKREGIKNDSRRFKEFATIRVANSVLTSHLTVAVFNALCNRLQSSCEIRKTNRHSANIENRVGSNNVVWIARDIRYLRAGSTISIFSPKSRRTTGHIRPNCNPTLENSSFRLVFLCRQGRPR